MSIPDEMLHQNSSGLASSENGPARFA
uniref:Uncharacterized protein n=1 Tax=Homo sapiens TaxID=9606 RepID=Q96HQ8_HUMAN|nr:Unknown (protein for MGC:9921) [Homo sapiens]